MLTVAGYSVHDTIVVFDRIRENMIKGTIKDFEKIVDFSINETFVRSLNTSLTVTFRSLCPFPAGRLHNTLVCPGSFNWRHYRDI